MSGHNIGDRASNEIGQGAQTGDISIRDTAAGNIYQGANADNIVDLLKYQIDKESQYRMLDLNVREVRQQLVDKELKAIHTELRNLRIVLIVGLVALVVLMALLL